MSHDIHPALVAINVGHCEVVVFVKLHATRIHENGKNLIISGVSEILNDLRFSVIG